MPAAAGDAAFEALLRTPPASLDDVCRDGIVRHRIARWRQGERRAEEELAALMRRCVAEIEKAGISPSR